MDYLFAPERVAMHGLVLRSYRPGDGRLLADAVNESYAHLSPWVAWARAQQSVEESERLVREFRGRYLLAQDFTLAIFDKEERRLLGGAGFHLREGPLPSGCEEVGMFVRRSAAGAGIGTRALRAMLAWGFDAWPWLRLSWCCDSRNVASLRIAEKAGMGREGVVRGQADEVGQGRRDLVRFAALKNEWVDPGE